MASAGEKGKRKRRQRREADFAAREIEKLRRFAGAKCSYPECGVETDAKRSDADGVLNVGIAAHIHAAEPGAARYRADQPPEERRSALKNGIWLCMRCSKRIDAEWKDHPAELLFEWRRQREDAQHDWVVRGVTLSADRGREFGAATIALLTFAFVFGYMFGPGWLTLTFSTAAAVAYSFARYYRARSAELSRQLAMLTAGSTALATGGAAGWTWKRLLTEFAPVFALFASMGLGVGWASKSVHRTPEPTADVTETVEVENPPTPAAHTPPPEPPPPPPERMGAPGPPQQIHVISDDKEDDPFELSPVLDGVNQEVVGDPGQPKRIWVGQVQPTRHPGFLGMMVLRNLELHALANGASTIGGTPDKSSGEAAPIMIEDSIIDSRIKLGRNVHTNNVRHGNL